MKIELTKYDLFKLIQADGRFEIEEEFFYPMAEYSERIYKNKKLTYKTHSIEVDEAFSISFDLKDK